MKQRSELDPARPVRAPRCERRPRERSRRNERTVDEGASPSPCPSQSRFVLQPDWPSPQSQSLSRSYGSNLPTSLTYIVASTRGCEPWRPAADMGTAWHENHESPSDFQGPARAHRTPQEPRCFTGTPFPYLRASRFQGSGPLQRKENSSRGSRRRLRLRLRCRTRPLRANLRVQVREY